VQPIQPAQPIQPIQPVQPIQPIQPAASGSFPRNTNDVATNVIAPAARPLTPAPGDLPPVRPVVAPPVPPGVLAGAGPVPVVAPASPPGAQGAPGVPLTPAPAVHGVMPMVHAPAHPSMMEKHGDDHGNMMNTEIGLPGRMAKEMAGMHDPAQQMAHPMADPHPQAVPAAAVGPATRMVMAPVQSPPAGESAPPAAGAPPMKPVVPSAPPLARSEPNMDFGASTRIVSVGGLRPPVAPPLAQPSRADMMDKTLVRPSPAPESPMHDTLIQSKPMVSHDSQGYDPLVGWLVVVMGPGKGNSRPVRYGMNSVGSSSTNRVPLDFGDDAISRESHCFIVYDDKKRTFHITHGGRTNLVRLNDEVVLGPMMLGAGDEISLGQSKLKFIPLAGPNFAWEELQG
jgi:hypothetical protein